jgi:hypothetical protein
MLLKADAIIIEICGCVMLTHHDLNHSSNNVETFRSSMLAQNILFKIPVFQIRGKERFIVFFKLHVWIYFLNMPAEGIRGLMGEKGLMEEDWNDRSKWRKKIL